MRREAEQLELGQIASRRSMCASRLTHATRRIWSRLLFLVALSLFPAASLAQERVSPLPPPITRGLYRSRWFEFLNAHLEDDARAAAVGLSELKKAAQTVGVHRLSDFSRAAVYEAREAEAQGRVERAQRAYEAAVELDDANPDAHFSRLTFLARHREYARAAYSLPAAAASLLKTRESRLAVLSAVAAWSSAGLAAAVLAMILVLFLRQARLSAHAVAELGRRFFGKSAMLPLALILLALPLAFGLGPLWLILYWGALLFFSSDRRERLVLGVGLLALGFVSPLVTAVSHENIVQRSPLYVAAVDLEERREDASAEDGLAQASGVFGEDPDVWLLRGIYAERSLDRSRALAAYDRSVRADPSAYEALLNRGNVQFQEGNYAQAIDDYKEAAGRAPRAAEAYYNLALARAEIYDFEGQEEALRRARQISPSEVARWSSHSTLARVVSLSYPLSRARARIEQWNREPRGGRLPGHASSLDLGRAFASVFTIGPWSALLLGLLAWLAGSRRAAAECLDCGSPHCRYCRRYGDPGGYCATCARAKRGSKGIDFAIERAGQARKKTRSRDIACRSLSALFPGTHQFFSGRPGAGLGILFLFFFALSAAAIDNPFLGPRRLAPGSPWTGLTAGALAVAGVIWLISVVSSWRRSHGS